MMTSSSVFVVSCYVCRVAIVILVFLAALPSYAQPPVSVMLERLGSQILRGPGSQIGVSTRDFTPAEARDDLAFWSRPLGQQHDGVVIEQVRAGSPASRAGLVKGDVVTVFDGERVVSTNQFSRLVGETPPGWTVRMTILRNGKARDIFITPTL